MKIGEVIEKLKQGQKEYGDDPTFLLGKLILDLEKLGASPNADFSDFVKMFPKGWWIEPFAFVCPQKDYYRGSPLVYELF